MKKSKKYVWVAVRYIYDNDCKLQDMVFHIFDSYGKARYFLSQNNIVYHYKKVEVK